MAGGSSTSTAVKRVRSLSPSHSPSAAAAAAKKAKLHSNVNSRNPTAGNASTTSAPGQLSILSWNVDNPAPYLDKTAGSSSTASGSRAITSYLTKSPSRAQAKSSSANKSDAGKSTARAKPNKSNSPTLHDIFAVHGYPLVCCLQEVKCMARDKEGIRLLRRSAAAAQVPNSKTKLASGKVADSDSDSTSDEGSSTKLQDVRTSTVPTYTAHFSLCQATHGAKRFGVGTFVSSAFPYQYSTREVTWDAEGRVLIMTVPALKVAIINVYALNGSEFAWKDPLSGQIKGTRNERKRVFNSSLKDECIKLRDEQELKLVLVGDWNISREKRDCFPRLRIEEPHSRARREFNEAFIPPLDVVDIFREVHGDKRSYSWFSRTKPDRTDAARVDYALISRSLSESVKRIEYLEEPKWRYSSDHAPFVLELAGLERQTGGAKEAEQQRQDEADG